MSGRRGVWLRSAGTIWGSSKTLPAIEASCNVGAPARLHITGITVGSRLRPVLKGFRPRKGMNQHRHPGGHSQHARSIHTWICGV